MSVPKLPPPFAGAVTPTAHIPPPGIAVMAAKPVSEPLPRVGLETSDHTPFLPCRTSGSWLPDDVLMSQPTAQVEPSAAVVTANKSFSPVPAFGVVWMVSAPCEPATTLVVYGAISFSRSPTKVSVEEVAVIPRGNAEAEGSDGLDTTLQAFPSQCSTSA